MARRDAPDEMASPRSLATSLPFSEFMMEATETIPRKVRLARAYLRYSPVGIGKHWLWERLRWRKHIVQAHTRYGATLECDTGSGIEKMIYYFGVWEPNVSQWVQQSLQPGDVFVDVGAHIGYYTLLAAKRVCPAGKVIAIEASPSTYDILCRNIEANRVENVQSFNAAAADKRGTLELWGHYKDTGRTGAWRKPGWASRGEVPAIPLHELLNDTDWERTRLVKVDTEGYEHSVLVGMEPKLRQCRPDCEFLLELIPSRYGREKLREILDTFSAHGFHPYRMVNPYSAEYYLSGRTDFGAWRIDSPYEITSATDVVFSRREGEHLWPVGSSRAFRNRLRSAEA